MTANNPFASPPPPFQEPNDWRASALCAQVDPDLFFPEKGGRTEEAKRICRKCPVRAECLEEVLNSGADRYGIWGGHGERERRDMRPARVGGKRIDRAEAVRLYAKGLQMTQIAKLLNCTPASVSHALKRQAS